LATVHSVDRNTVTKELTFAASGSLTADAVVAFLAGRIEGHDNLVADTEVADFVALLENLADKLVSADEVWRAFEMTSVEVQIAAAECGAGDFQDSISWLLQLWIWAVLHGNLDIISTDDAYCK
jgi:hypothetical protein